MTSSAPGVALSVMALFVVAVYADAWSTLLALKRGARETNPLLARAHSLRQFSLPLLVAVLPFGLAALLLGGMPGRHWAGEARDVILLVILTMSLGKLHAALENLALACLGNSPSNALRHRLRLCRGWAHFVFNGVYFGLFWAVVVGVFLADRV